MKMKKIKLFLNREGMRFLCQEVAIVENELDENYKFIKSETIESLHHIHFTHEWINKEISFFFFEVEQWEKLFRDLCEQLGGKEIKSNIFGCVIKDTPENREIVRSGCISLQQNLNKLFNF